MRKYRQGYFTPKNPQKYVGDVSKIVFRSGWEWKFMNWCDQNPSVLNWNSESIIIPYYSQADGKQRRYYVDAALKMQTADGDTKTLLIEIKPEKQTKPPVVSKRKKQSTVIQEAYDWQVNQDKWIAANEFAKGMGAEFVIMNEYDLGIKTR